MASVLESSAASPPGAPLTTARNEARAVLLGLGRVGSAVADLLARETLPAGPPVRIAGAVVRRERGTGRPFPTCTNPSALLDQSPDVVIEALGGLEPARALVLEALGRRIPVVTANKTLLAVHGDELLAAARRFDVALRYEASVIAGVPFLGTFRNRPLAARADGVIGILNGTSNYILSRVDEGLPAEHALADAQARGYAEPDASKDLNGSDAAEKLAILVRCFANLSLQPGDVPATTIEGIGPHDLARARELGGRLKPVAFARWTDRAVACFVGPAFLPAADPLAGLEGVLNGIRIERAGAAPLHFTGPGAGPEITARTMLDDVVEVLRNRRADPSLEPRSARVRHANDLGAFVTLRAPALPDPVEVADLLAGHNLWVRRWGVPRPEPGGIARSVLLFPCEGPQLESALHALSGAAGCATTACPALEAPHV